MSHLKLLENHHVYDTVKLLEELIHLARMGELVGFAGVAFRRQEAYSIAFTGTAYSDPERAIGAIHLLVDDLKDKARG